MSSYQKIKIHIFGNLQKKQEVKALTSEAIKREIDNTKLLISNIGLVNFALVLSEPSIKDPSNDDWRRMERELETQFSVVSKEGILIQGLEQKDRDTTWWTGKISQEHDTYYWDRFEKFLKKSLPEDVVRTINIDTDIIMNNIENPEDSDIRQYDIRGMVVGHVQSGKTGNYSALICKAADAGYKFIVVIAGGINNLRDQTQARLNESFIGRDKGKPVGVGLGDPDLSKLPISLTTVEADFNKQDANRNSQSSNFDNTSTPILLVIKKNTSTLSSVIEWLENQYGNRIAKHGMLMIDDESDYASINTNDEDNPTTINRKLRHILSLFEKRTYVAYTATPYANIFIDHEASNYMQGNDLFPKDFIYALDAPSNYFGARKVFLDTNRKHLVALDDHLDDIPRVHKKDWLLPSIPESLYEAMRVFVINVSIRGIRGQENKHNSMLIHATLFTDVHKKFARHADDYISKVKSHINTYGKLNDAVEKSYIIQQVRKTYELRYSELDPEEKPQWQEVLASLCNMIKTVVVREVHKDKIVPLVYRDDRPTNAIVVGGTSLSRGYTLEGLSVSYFIRNTIFYDTLMQMGRWFGYRPGYEDLCRIYMSETMIDNFSHIIESTEELIDDFKLMAENNQTPNEFGLAVKQHPDSALQITARNKQKNIKEFSFNMKLDGRLKETNWLPSSREYKKQNLVTIEKIVKKLNNYSKEKIAGHFLWRGIDKNLVLAFLNDFRIYQTDALGISERMPISFIKKYAEDNKGWDVALYGGKGKEDLLGINRETRTARAKDKYIEIRQISTGNSESIALKKDLRKKLGSNRRETRQHMKSPLLMLHIFETSLDERLASFGASFPGDVLSQGKTVSIMINTVYYNNLLGEIDREENADDKR